MVRLSKDAGSKCRKPSSCAHHCSTSTHGRNKHTKQATLDELDTMRWAHGLRQSASAVAHRIERCRFPPVDLVRPLLCRPQLKVIPEGLDHQRPPPPLHEVHVPNVAVSD